MKPVVDVDGLSTEWLSSALDRDVRLDSCERIGTGQTAATYRLTIDGDGLPPSIVAKVATGDEAARHRVRNGVRAEVGFYAHLAARVDLRAPLSWYAAASSDALQFTVLLEDLAPRTPGVQAEGCSTPRAEHAVQNLAGLHAPTWDDETVFDLAFLRRPTAEGAAFLGASTIASADVFIDRYDDALSQVEQETLRTAAAATEGWLQSRPSPWAVLHGDYRLDNLMFGPDDRDVVAVDWQTLVVGLPARDVAYFAGTCLGIEQRRSIEDTLVSIYHEALVRRGVQGYTHESCFEDYRLGQLQGPMITMIGAAYATSERTRQADDMFLAMAHRSCAAIRDLGTLDLL